MLRISYVSPRFGESTVAFHRNVVRFGRAPDCEVCVADCEDERVALHHGEVIREGAVYVVVASDVLHGIWIDGTRRRKATLKGGESLRLGGSDGPELQVLEASASEDPLDMETEAFTVQPHTLGGIRPNVSVPTGDHPVFDVGAIPVRVSPTISSTELPAAAQGSQDSERDAPPEGTFATRLAKDAARGLMRLMGKPTADVEEYLGRAQRDLAKARSRSRGKSSGDTMVIMAQALMGLRETSELKNRRWRRSLALVVGVSAVLLGVLTTVIWSQHKRINHLVSEKVAIDAQIQDVFAQMVTETDEQKLAQLEAQLQVLMGAAANKIIQVGKVAPRKAEKLEQPVDPLEVEIRKILVSFNAETYAIPPIFKVALKQQMDDLIANKGVPGALSRKERYWPAIQRALKKQKLPEALGYIAYTESHFDPTAVNAKSGASGMWQLMEQPARTCGIVVKPKHDDRFNPGRSSDAAACYLSKLLVEFGEQSFLLVLASYNRGENGVRRALHRVASEPGGYKKRDFWHLYRLKLLPEETRDYVPRVLAAAIVLGNPEKYGIEPRD